MAEDLEEEIRFADKDIKFTPGEKEGTLTATITVEDVGFGELEVEEEKINRAIKNKKDRWNR